MTTHDDPNEYLAVVIRPWGQLPMGKLMLARRKYGDASPYPIWLYGDHSYQCRENEVALFPRGSVKAVAHEGFCGIKQLVDGQWVPWKSFDQLHEEWSRENHEESTLL